MLQARCLAHARENRAQPCEPFLRALNIDACFIGQLDLFQIVEGGSDHRDRRAQFVRQATGQRFQIAGVLLQPAQNVGEAARQVAEFVPGIRAADGALYAAVGIDRILGLIPQAADAQRQPRCKGQQRGGAAEVDDEQGGEQFFECAIAQRQHVVGRLLDQHGADHLVFQPHRLSGREHDRARIRRKPAARAGLPRERFIDFASFQTVGTGRDVLEILVRFRHREPQDRSHQNIGGSFPETRESALVRIDLRRWRTQRTRLRNDAAVDVEHPDARARTAEPSHQFADLRRRHDHGAESLFAGRIGRADRAGGRPGRGVVDIDDGKTQARSHQRAWQAQFHQVASRQQAKHGLDARVGNLFAFCRQ